ncbi:MULTISPECIES: DUF948 domain-containing protein [unclassified Psychrobacillus]|uniref:DUF948 domain-containing protein n=1 Tax=unclassified Psychrobacillus TaxID=2636677 RepID=UPI00146B4736|nr:MULTISPECIES: DUF948 domain-containing protein [unclassified Psychrobacillus]MCM3359275.1 DUF948 domain-containing protein [Psychrobacillus sp. MER TA 171]NME06309.1 DUF948 domain-containing protein [Psychrobacillus sp. BL-248-WT-3]
MENLLYIAAIVAAIAFLILCISLAVTLSSVKKTLNNVAETLDGLETHLQNVTKETAELLHKTNELAVDIQDKSEKLNTVVDAVKNVGVSVNGFNNSIQRLSTSVTTEVEKNEDKIAQVVQWSSIFLGIRDKWKERKAMEQAGFYTFEKDNVK